LVQILHSSFRQVHIIWNAKLFECIGYILDGVMFHKKVVLAKMTFNLDVGTAYCTGRGELIQSLPPLKDASHTEVHILKPR